MKERRIIRCVKEIKIAVTGGRIYNNVNQVEEVLGRLKEWKVTLAHGDAPGADTLCKEYGLKMGWTVVPYPALWKKYGSFAGPIRNAFLLDNFKPQILIAFSGNNGTSDMIKRALDKGIKVIYANKIGRTNEAKEI